MPTKENEMNEREKKGKMARKNGRKGGGEGGYMRPMFAA